MQRFVPGNRLITKSTDGRIFVWDIATLGMVSAWKVPGSSAMGGFATRCQFGTTPDGRYVAVVRDRSTVLYIQSIVHVYSDEGSESELPYLHCIFLASLSFYLCSYLQGNATGDCYVYDATNGQRLAHTCSIRVTAPVRAIGLTPDCRHLVAAIGKGFIFRFEYLGKDEEENDENADNGAENPEADEGEEEEGPAAAGTTEGTAGEDGQGEDNGSEEGEAIEVQQT